LLVILQSMKSGIISAQAMKETGKAVVPKSQSRFRMGFYAGVNEPFNPIGKVSDIGPSFMMNGSYRISEKWQVELGFGGVFYYGKSLGYMHSKNVFDTVYSKKYTVTGCAYTTVPVIFKYNLNREIHLLAGIRWLGVTGIFGNGSYGIYSPTSKDSFIFKSNIIPGLPKGSSFEDVQGLAGIELAFNRHLSARLMVNFGFIPIYPGNLTDIISPLSGNYNQSIELGINYTVTP